MRYLASNTLLPRCSHSVRDMPHHSSTVVLFKSGHDVRDSQGSDNTNYLSSMKLGIRQHSSNQLEVALASW